MNKVRKFFEFFDDEELRDRHEIEYLTGKIRDLANTTDVNFKSEDINKFISKISYTFPFMLAFSEASASPTGKKRFSDFNVGVRYDEESGYWNFITTDEVVFLILSVKILGGAKYDVGFYLDDTTIEDIKYYEAENVDYLELCAMVSQLYVQSAMDLGYDELIEYNFEEIVLRSN